MSLRRHSYGYTLIEVLVAMMILAISLTVIFRIFSGGLHKIGTASDYARAVMVAESVLAAAGNTETLQTGESSGRFFEKYHWVRTVTPYRAPGEQPGENVSWSAWRVSVVVEWPANRGNRRIDLSTLKLRTRRR